MCRIMCCINPSKRMAMSLKCGALVLCLYNETKCVFSQPWLRWRWIRTLLKSKNLSLCSKAIYPTQHRSTVIRVQSNFLCLDSLLLRSTSSESTFCGKVMMSHTSIHRTSALVTNLSHQTGQEWEVVRSSDEVWFICTSCYIINIRTK